MAHLAHAHPLCPAEIAEEIALRVATRRWDPKASMGEAVGIMITGYLRHTHTRYEQLMDIHHLPRSEARRIVLPQIEAIMAGWRAAGRKVKARPGMQEDQMQYIAIIDGLPGAYGVAIPDCPGCVAMGDTMDEAEERARIALADWAVSVLVAQGELPKPSTMEEIAFKHQRDFADCLGLTTITLGKGAFEDAADVASYLEAKTDVEGSQLTPPPVAASILKGDGVVTAYRKHRGMGLTFLADMLDIAPSDLAAIEAREVVATDDLLSAIAKALDIPPSALR